MPIGTALWTIVELYDDDWPLDLREAGHVDKAEILEYVMHKMMKNEEIDDTMIEPAIELADFMVKCQQQRDGS